MSATHFRFHHQEAQIASRRLKTQFYTCILLSSVIYAVSVYLLLVLIYAFFNGFNSDAYSVGFWYHIFSEHHGEMSKISLITAALVSFIVLTEYVIALKHYRQHGARLLAQKMGAKPFPMNGLPREMAKFKQMRNVVEELSVAAHIKPPELFYLPKDDTINAFVVGGQARSTVLVVSQGMMNILRRDEQQAVIAHEIAHIVDEDVFLYAQLTAILEGFWVMSQWREEPIIKAAPEGFLYHSLSYQLYLQRFLGVIGWILYLFGRYIQSAFSRQRELMADAKAVEYTRYPEALVSALKKALALHYLKKQFYKPRPQNAHILFINYFNSVHFATHPSLEERIARYGGKIDKRELDALAYELDHSQYTPNIEEQHLTYRHAFEEYTFYPIHFIKNKQNAAITLPDLTPETLCAAINSFFIYHSGLSIFELQQSYPNLAVMPSAPFLEQLEQTHPLLQPLWFNRYTNRAREQLNAEQQKSLKQTIMRMIRLDNMVSFYEWCYSVLLDDAFGAPRGDAPDEATERAIYVRIVTFIAQHAFGEIGENNEQIALQKTLYRQLLRQISPYFLKNDPPPFAPHHYQPSTFKILFQDMKMLRFLSSGRRQNMQTALDQEWGKRMQMSLNEVYLRYTLTQILHTAP